MERKIKKTVNIKDIHFEEDLYPRSSYSWQTAYSYAQSMVQGAEFPPIKLAMLNDKMYLVDGKHRSEAKKMNKEKTIKAIIHVGWNKKKIFIESIHANITHGKGLGAYDKRKIALRLKEMSVSQKEISQIIQIPFGELENFVGSMLVSSITGEAHDPSDNTEFARRMAGMIVKSPLKHLAGQVFEDDDLIELEKTQRSLRSISQHSLLKNLFILLDRGLIDTNDEGVMILIAKVKTLLRKY